MNSKVSLSVIAPAYNEQKTIKKFIKDVDYGLKKLKTNYEILICENGSTDNTFRIVSQLAQKNKSINLFHQDEPNYGKALKLGIEKAQADKVIIFNVDFYDLDFLEKAYQLLNKFDFIIGSKNLPESADLRPFHRRLLTKVFNLFLRLFFGFFGTDTHGIKAIRKSSIERILNKCKTKGEIFDTEIILRAQREGLKFTEIPVRVSEVRPSRYSLISRVPKTFFDLISLAKALR